MVVIMAVMRVSEKMLQWINCMHGSA